jgi:LPS-assembly protein
MFRRYALAGLALGAVWICVVHYATAQSSPFSPAAVQPAPGQSDPTTHPTGGGSGAAPAAAAPAAAPATPPPAVPLLKAGQAAPVSQDQPVAFTADNFNYDRTAGIVTASGHVEAWQNDHLLRADKVTFDRNTNVAAAEGNVVLVEPDGQVLFADYAELTQGMREGVLKGMRSILAENGKLASNGARRVDGKINELTHAVYTSCDLCKTDPTKPPLWQLRAYTAVQDIENKRIEYRDAYLDIAGIPVLYFPYLSHTDPSVHRSSGFLAPSFGNISHAGAFYEMPYFWAIDDNQDVTLYPEITTELGPQLTADYRRRFNNGSVNINAGTAYDDNSPQYYVFAHGAFNYDDTFRYGFNVDRTSSTNYLRDFDVQGYNSVLTSTAFIEGFGVGAYTKLDIQAYQGLSTTIDTTKLPYVLPRYEYSYFGEPDALGGRLSFDTTDFNISRPVGNDTQQAGARLNWDRPFTGNFGEQYKLTLHADMVAYTATSLTLEPTFGTVSSTEGVHAQPTAALEVRWPFARDDATTGTQTIEPIIQVLEAPQAGAFMHRNIPNEDSLDYEFTDANLFSINRYAGVDRVEGGARANIGIHNSWTFGGALVDTLIGQSYREHLDNSIPLQSGDNRHVSDVVARATVIPNKYLDLTLRTRVDPRNGDLTFVDTIASAGVPLLRLNAGYLYSSTNPYFLFDQAPNTVPPSGYPASYFVPRDELTVGGSSQFGHYKVSGYVTRDMTLSKLVSAQLRGTYDDECFTFDVNLTKRYVSINGDNGDTSLLFTITLKTVGQFGYHAS